MSQPMLAIKQDQTGSKAVANLLPCRVHHNGSIDPVESYWNPTTNATDDTRTAYFRGRKLQGKTVKLPQECRGVVVERQIGIPQTSTAQPEVVDLENDDEPAAEIGTMQVTAEFDEMVVWSHEVLPDTTSDPYIRSVDEWLQVADQIHSYSEHGSDTSK